MTTEVHRRVLHAKVSADDKIAKITREIRALLTALLIRVWPRC